MTDDEATPRRDYEEALRSLGLVFDELQLQDVMLLERETGFLVTALGPSDQLLADEPHKRWRFVEYEYDEHQVTAASMRGAAQRGTRHRANRNELAFRLIGRFVNSERGSRVLVIDQGDGFMVRTLVDAATDLPHRFVTISSSDLERLHEEALASRGGPGVVR